MKIALSTRPSRETLAEIYGEAIEKYVRGEKRYGAFSPETDQRDLIQEAIEELEDSLNYICMRIIQLRRLKGDHL